jgi:acetolactate synthase-1/2/3 large subunit
MSDPIPGGALVAAQLAEAGVGTVFALAGAGHTHLLLPLSDLGVRIIGTRHESGAVGAADGYARATGKIGVAAIIAEQGLPNAMTALQTAYQYGSAIVVLVTRFPESWMEVAGEVPVDHHAMLRPVTKWVRTVSSTARLGEYVEAALRIAAAGRPGPVVLVIPQDFLATPVPVASRRPTPLPVLAAAASADAVAAMLAVLATAQRPALLVDSGCTGADAALAQLAQRFGLPVFAYGGARGAVAEDDARGILPWPYAQFAMGACDLLIIAGSRLNMWFGFGRAPRFPDDLKVVQIDTEAEAIGRNRAVTLGIAADPGLALGQLADALVANGHPRWSHDWLDAALAPRREAVAAIGSGEQIHAVTLVQALERHRPRNGFVAGDGADILNWSYSALRIARPRGYMDHHPMGAMGTGLPLAIGAAAAEVDLASAEGRAVCPVLLLTGDGAIGFYLAELDTVARANLPLKIVIGNDAQWGTEFHGQILMTGRNVNTRLVLRDYAQIAEGLGVAGRTVDAAAELEAAVSGLFEDTVPMLLDVRIDPAAGMALKRDPRLSFLIFSDLAPPQQ